MKGRLDPTTGLVYALIIAVAAFGITLGGCDNTDNPTDNPTVETALELSQPQLTNSLDGTVSEPFFDEAADTNAVRDPKKVSLLQQIQ